MRDFGLTSTPIFKSLTANTSNIELESLDPVPLPLDERLLVLFQGRETSKIPPVPISQEFSNFYAKNIKLELAECVNLFTIMTFQSECSAWFEDRKLRISASIAHAIRGARIERTMLQYFNRTTVDTLATRYGKTMEVQAKKKFASLHSIKVIESGLVVHPSEHWLCASPDRFFLESNEELCLLK